MKNPHIHQEDSGKYRMAGYQSHGEGQGYYYYACSKCGKKIMITYGPRLRENSS